MPEWEEKDRQILVFSEIGVTYVLGSDYYGEAKKGFLRMVMWAAKQEGMLGVHAGAKIVKAKDKTRRIRRYSMILFGLSATGKTTHACHNHGLLDYRECRHDYSNKILRQAVRVEIPEMAAIIRAIVRDPIEWKHDPYFGTLVSRKVN